VTGLWQSEWSVVLVLVLVLVLEPACPVTITSTIGVKERLV